MGDGRLPLSAAERHDLGETAGAQARLHRAEHLREGASTFSSELSSDVSSEVVRVAQNVRAIVLVKGNDAIVVRTIAGGASGTSMKPPARSPYS